MRYIAVLCFLFFGAIGLSAQNTDSIYSVTEVPAMFAGGDSALFMYIKSNLKPPASYNEEIPTGRVLVRLVIEKDGKVSSPLVVKGLSKALDEEVLRFAGTLPAFNPAQTGGKAVRSYYSLPVRFKATKRDTVIAQPVVAKRKTRIYNSKCEVDEMPAFPGGDAVLGKYITRIYNYPDACLRNFIYGYNEVSVTVNEDGSLSNIYISKSAHLELDSESLRIINSLPDFIPAMKDGKSVACELVFPFAYNMDQVDTLNIIPINRMPAKYPYGNEAMIKSINYHVRQLANRDMGNITGRSAITFTIDTEGKAGKYMFSDGTFKAVETIMKEALDSLQRFEPAVVNGQKVPVQITFGLDYHFEMMAVRRYNSDINSTTDYISLAWNIYKVSETEETYSYIEHMPEFDGVGFDTLETLLKRHISEGAYKVEKNGVVLVSVYVTKEGQMKNVQVYKSDAPELNEGALAIVKQLKVTKPAKVRDRLTDVELLLPLRFKKT